MTFGSSFWKKGQCIHIVWCIFKSNITMIAKVCVRESRRDTWFENRLVGIEVVLAETKMFKGFIDFKKHVIFGIEVVSLKLFWWINWFKPQHYFQNFAYQKRFVLKKKKAKEKKCCNFARKCLVSNKAKIEYIDTNKCSFEQSCIILAAIWCVCTPEEHSHIPNRYADIAPYHYLQQVIWSYSLCVSQLWLCL